MKRTYQPKKKQRKRVHGFLKRKRTHGGKQVIKKRRQKMRKRLSA
ncbi:MAG: 50S ribosomal protein L34 [Bacillota bacterium]